MKTNRLLIFCVAVFMASNNNDPQVSQKLYTAKLIEAKGNGEAGKVNISGYTYEIVKTISIVHTLGN